MLLRMPAPYLEVRLLFTLVVSIEVSGAENTQLVLTGCVIVSEAVGVVRQLIGESSVAKSHRLVVCLRESFVIFSARHSQLLSRIALVRGHGRERGQLRLLVGG